MEFSVIWLRSLATAKEFPSAQFSGDTDMATDGFVSLTSVERPELILARLSSEEWSLQPPQGALSAEQRLNAELGRSDLRACWLVRVEEAAAPSAAATFQDFRRRHIPPVTIHRDIYSPDGEAEVVREESAAEFLASGGAIFQQQGPNKPLEPTPKSGAAQR